MTDILQILIKQINKLLDDEYKICEKYESTFIEEMYNLTLQIYDNYSLILMNVYKGLYEREMSVDDVVKYFVNERLPFKAIRAKVRGVVQHPYYEKNKHRYWFALGMLGVLEGGIHQSSEILLNSPIFDSDTIQQSIITLKGGHTLVDIITLYDKNNWNSLYYIGHYAQYKTSDEQLEEMIRCSLLENIKKQIDIIDKYWQVVCNHYPYLIYRK